MLRLSLPEKIRGIGEASRANGGLGVTLVVNWLVKPFSMAVFGASPAVRSLP
jgi:ACR3 family arsenite efflux pump ArsB